MADLTGHYTEKVGDTQHIYIKAILQSILYLKYWNLIFTLFDCHSFKIFPCNNFLNMHILQILEKLFNLLLFRAPKGSSTENREQHN